MHIFHINMHFAIYILKRLVYNSYIKLKKMILYKMARKTKKLNVHEFTVQIHSTRRTNTIFAELSNHNEKLAKENKSLCCHDCRHFDSGCSEYIGKYHKTCNDFEWVVNK